MKQNKKKKLWKWQVAWSFSEVFFSLDPKSEKMSRKSTNIKDLA